MKMKRRVSKGDEEGLPGVGGYGGDGLVDTVHNRQ